jgi:pyruvate/2-oxoglutarate/acetoin dehydrogenase E1 component
VSESLSYHEARTRAIARELGANPDAVLIGPSLSLPFNPDDGLAARFPDQVLVPPYSELATVAAGVGAAIGGLRPLVALSTASFMFYAWPAIVNEAPLVRYLSGGTVGAPVAFHVHAGSRRGGGPQHEHTPQAMLQNVPGLRVIAPGTPADIDAALHAALTGPDPTVIVDHVLLAEAHGPVAPDPVDPLAPAMLRSGADALLVTSSVMTQRALAAAELLEADGLAVSVLNMPVIAPAPLQEVVDAASSHRAVIFVEESRAPGSPASLLMASVLGRHSELRARLVCSRDAPAPFALHLLDEVVPTVSRIVDAVRGLVAGVRAPGRA